MGDPRHDVLVIKAAGGLLAIDAAASRPESAPDISRTRLDVGDVADASLARSDSGRDLDLFPNH
jgi:hypothetical protein